MCSLAVVFQATLLLLLPKTGFLAPQHGPALPRCSLGLHFKQMLEEEREQRRVV